MHACVEYRHRSREFVGFLRRYGAAYPADTATKLILDNRSAHISKETKAWIASQPERRFCFVFTPKHGSWLNLVEGFLSKEPIVALIAGILVLLIPRLLNFIVAIYLILIGISELWPSLHLTH